MSQLKKRSRFNLGLKSNMSKETILRNFKFVVLDKSSKSYTFLNSEKEVKLYKFQDGDVLVDITKDNTKVAVKRNYVELV